MSNILSSIISYTNLVLTLLSPNQDLRKFIAWNIEGSEPVEVLQNLQIMRITVENQKKIFEHPIENGLTIADHEVLEPQGLSLEAYIAIDDASTLNELTQLYMNGTKLKIRADNRVLNNMVISAQPSEITGAIFDKTKYQINFKQALEVTPQYIAMPKAKKPANKSRVDTGASQAKKTNKSWLYDLLNPKK